ncbi:hypothetical protein SP6_13 [Salmonella phage SP6]|uniref:12 n=2 Tax=Enterobacteria phage SP6 TaxID=2907955 RepID=Q6UGK5_BPSP6|nr:gp13 [Salmonella phage SP6]AAP48752.1 gp13 [Salmonella phage SP6]AAR90004.1 12 [Salmonella phage SP6]
MTKVTKLTEHLIKLSEELKNSEVRLEYYFIDPREDDRETPDYKFETELMYENY